MSHIEWLKLDEDDDINSYEVIYDKQVINNDILKNTSCGKYLTDGIGALVDAIFSLNSIWRRYYKST